MSPSGFESPLRHHEVQRLPKGAGRPVPFHLSPVQGMERSKHAQEGAEPHQGKADEQAGQIPVATPPGMLRVEFR